MNACILFAKHKLFKKNIKQETVDKNYPLFRIKLFSISYLNNIDQFFFWFQVEHTFSIQKFLEWVISIG